MLNGMANALSFTDRIEASIPYYERALALAPEVANVHFNDATILARARAALNAASSRPASATADQAP